MPLKLGGSKRASISHIRFLLIDGEVKLLLPDGSKHQVDRKNLFRLAEWIQTLPPVWKPQDLLVYQNWYDAIVTEASDELSDWERNFMESIEIKLLQKRQLTENQAATLERIYAQKTR